MRWKKSTPVENPRERLLIFKIISSEGLVFARILIPVSGHSSASLRKSITSSFFMNSLAEKRLFEIPASAPIFTSRKRFFEKKFSAKTDRLKHTNISKNTSFFINTPP